jgi:hypothetical protein
MERFLGFSENDRRASPGFPIDRLALANAMRLSLVKAAHADVGGAPWQEIRVAHLFRPRYALANLGHPSCYFSFAVGSTVACERLWYPTSREKGARCGAPGTLIKLALMGLGLSFLGA